MECPASGSGEIEIRITGLPAGVEANLVLGGPLGSRSITADTTFGEAAGPYVLTPGGVAQPDPIVRTLFDHELSETEFCLEDGGTHRVDLADAPIPTSHRLWTNNSERPACLPPSSRAPVWATPTAWPSIRRRQTCPSITASRAERRRLSLEHVFEA
jgi:hypothetical protein